MRGNASIVAPSSTGPFQVTDERAWRHENATPLPHAKPSHLSLGICVRSFNWNPRGGLCM